jgi:hypothetical protein
MKDLKFKNFDEFKEYLNNNNVDRKVKFSMTVEGLSAERLMYIKHQRPHLSYGEIVKIAIFESDVKSSTSFSKQIDNIDNMS